MTHRTLLAAALLILLTGASCVRIRPTQSTGGVWLSSDGGKQWSPVSALYTTGAERLSFQGDDVTFLSMDPTNSRVLYAGRRLTGVAMSTDGGKQWLSLETLPRETVTAFLVNPLRPCTLFSGNTRVLLKSVDCGHQWQRALELPADTRVTAIVSDREPIQHLYVALSNGDLLRSDDDAKTWKTLSRTKAAFSFLLINKEKPNRIVALSPGQLTISNDFGETWADRTRMLPARDTAIKSALIVADPQHPDRLWLAGSAGLFRSDDLAETWVSIPLLTAPNTTIIRALALNPRNNEQIVYITDTTLYRSPNGGAGWETFKLPTPRNGRALIMHPEQPSILYLGVANPS